MKKSRFYFMVLVTAFALGGLFFWLNLPVQAEWILRDGTAVNPVAVCRDGAYIGVGVQFEGSAGVTARLLPGEQVLFAETFTPTTEVDGDDTPALIRADYYFVPFDVAYVPLTVGDEVNFGYPMGIEVIGRVGDCYIETDEMPTGVGFTYQGRLDDGGSTADGLYDLEFRVFDSAVSGMQVGRVVSHADVMVEDGLFTVELDFGPAVFTGSERWLEIAVRDGQSSGAYTTLAPRQEITAVPYALGLRAGAVISGSTLINEGLLSLKNHTGEGLIIERANNGIIVHSTVNAGMLVESTDTYGLYVNESHGDGVVIWQTDDEGVYVNQAGGTGLSVGSAGEDGLAIYGAGDDGVYVNRAANDGIYIGEAGDASTFNFMNNQNDGIEIANAEDDGIYIAHADGDGIDVRSATVGIRADGNPYAAVFHDDVYMWGNCTGCSLAIFARNNASDPLSRGDLVTIDGLATSEVLGDGEPVMNVRQAVAGDAVVGVVADAAEVLADENGVMLAPHDSSMVQPGAYMTVVIYGVAQMKVSPSGDAVAAGERLTLAEASNEVRPLQTTELDGLQLAENAPTVGTALEDFDGDSDGLIWVLINPR